MMMPQAYDIGSLIVAQTGHGISPLMISITKTKLGNLQHGWAQICDWPRNV